MAVASVRIGLSQLALDWIASVATLLETIEHADPALLEESIAEAAAEVRTVMWGYSNGGD